MARNWNEVVFQRVDGPHWHYAGFCPRDETDANMVDRSQHARSKDQFTSEAAAMNVVTLMSNWTGADAPMWAHFSIRPHWAQDGAIEVYLTIPDDQENSYVYYPLECQGCTSWQKG